MEATSPRAAVTRARLEMQGFVGLDDRRLAEIGPWLRLAPALCATWAAVGTLLAIPALLWALVPFAALGALRRGHPFDVLYNHGLRHLLGTSPLPPYGTPRRFACAVAAAWFTATALAFGAGMATLGYTLAAAFVAVALAPVTTDFCIPSFVFGLLFGWPARCERIAVLGRTISRHPPPLCRRLCTIGYRPPRCIAILGNGMKANQKTTMPARFARVALSVPQLSLIAATLLWGGNFVAGKALSGDVPPVAISFWRWSLALLVLLPLSYGELRRHRAMLLSHWRLIAAIGATGIAGYTFCFYQALAATSAINALLFISTAPLLITLASWLVFRDGVTPWQVGGTVVSSCGAVVVIAHGDAARLLSLRFNRGDLWILAGVLVWVAYSLLLRRRPAALPPLPFFTASAVAGVAFLVPLSCWQFARGERLALTVPSALGVLYVALGVSALGYACWTRGVAALGPDRAGSFLHLIPVCGTAMAILFLGESLEPYHLLGAALVAGGLGLASLRPAWVPTATVRQTRQPRLGHPAKSAR